MFSKRHYSFIAMVIAGFIPQEARCEIAHSFALRFMAENPRFDLVKFLKACGA